jgi:hypothetical protein
MKKIFDWLKFFIWNLLNPYKFKGSADTDMPVMAGLDALVFQDGRLIGWATNISFDEDFELQAIRTLGVHGDRGYKSQGYNCTVTVGTFTLEGKEFTDALKTSTRDSILRANNVQFDIIDKNNGKTLYVLEGCRNATKGVTFDSGSLSVVNTTWRCRRVIPKETSI